MDLRQLTPDLAVAPQLEPGDMPALAAEGVRLVIANRPDSEVGPELRHQVMAEAARAAGMQFRYLPLEPGRLTPGLVADFGAALEGAGRTVAYCRSGTRCATLWALSQAGLRPGDEILAAAARAGYDLRQFALMLDA